MTWLPLSQLDETEHSWRIQGNTVQFDGTGTYRKLRGCDPATFEVFAEPGCLIARDRNHVYHGAELLSAVQRDSFTHLGEGYWRDADAIYCEYETALRPLKGSDAATFRHLGEGYAADRTQAYYGGSKIQSANPLALRLLHGLYAADGDTVFFDGKPLKGSDPQTWREAAGEAGKHSFPATPNTSITANANSPAPMPPLGSTCTTPFPKTANASTKPTASCPMQTPPNGTPPKPPPTPPKKPPAVPKIPPK